MSIISVHNLSKTYRVHEKSAGFRNTAKDLFTRKYVYKQAVDDISFDVEPGEIVGLLGENGAGKTTSLKMLTGILYPIRAMQAVCHVRRNVQGELLVDAYSKFRQHSHEHTMCRIYIWQCGQHRRME